MEGNMKTINISDETWAKIKDQVEVDNTPHIARMWSEDWDVQSVSVIMRHNEGTIALNPHITEFTKDERQFIRNLENKRMQSQ